MSIMFGRVQARALAPQSFATGGLNLMPGTAERALRLIPFYAATTGIADDVSITPWHAYRGTGASGSVRLPKQPTLLVDPGVGIGPIAWMNQAIMSMLVRGFAFGSIVGIDSDGWPSKVIWVRPDRVRIDESAAAPVFFVDGREQPTGSFVYIPAALMPGSVIGLSPVALFRLQLSKAEAAQRYAAEFFDAGIMPPGVLKNTKKTLEDGQADHAKTRFKASVDSRDIFVTGNDWDWTALTVPRDDEIFLETIKASATEIAAIYRCEPEDIGGVSGSSLTYATLELNELKRNRRTLLPWVRRMEDALTAMRPRPQYVKANMDALARADLKSRMESHEIALRIGLETQPEGRALEDKPPLTVDELGQWQNLYGARKGQPITTSTGGQGA